MLKTRAVLWSSQNNIKPSMKILTAPILSLKDYLYLKTMMKIATNMQLDSIKLTLKKLPIESNNPPKARTQTTYKTP